MSKKYRGICNRCGYERTLLSLLRGYCKPCGYDYGQCAQCQAHRKLIVSQLCYPCYQDARVKIHIHQIVQNFTHPASQYNADLFQLFTTYTRRYRMTYCHIKTTHRLSLILKKNPIPVIQSWNQIYQLAKKYPLKSRLRGNKNRDNACAWIQIGFMLQELGVLGIRSDEYEHRIAKLIEKIDPETSKQILIFLNEFKKKGCTDSTRYHYLSHLSALHQGLSKLHPSVSIWLADSLSIQSYFDLLKKTHSYSNCVVIFRIIVAFYQWAKRKKLILIDPTEKIQFSRATQRLLICSKTQFNQLYSFIKTSDSDPQQALAVLLILFFGLTPRDLAQASLDPLSHPLKIILERKPRSRGRRYYHREQVLILTTQPSWLLQLQDRFFKCWHTDYSKILLKSCFPRTPLFLDPQCKNNRNLSSAFIQLLIARATASATGRCIPPRVLKQTCGHIHLRGNDASLLTQLGWSPQFAFHYTWLPRVQYAPSKGPVGTTPTGTGVLEGM